MVNGIKLAGRFQHFPAATETAGNNKAIAGTQGGGIARRIGNHTDAFQQAAEFFLGVIDAPFAYFAVPLAGEKLAGGIGVMVPN